MLDLMIFIIFIIIIIIIISTITMNWLLKAPESAKMLFQKMPRNPNTKRYDNCSSLSEKVQRLKFLFIMYKGEVREIFGEWKRISATGNDKNTQALAMWCAL